jgi:hypothetical protein
LASLLRTLVSDYDGMFFRLFLPVLNTSVSSGNTNELANKNWWLALLLAACISLIGGINSNLPCKPRELLKSLVLGLALDAAKLLPHSNP